jgi:hypothetical protein
MHKAGLPRSRSRQQAKQPNAAIHLDLSWTIMPFPIRTCAICGEEFELKPDKPGFANRCPACSEPEENDAQQQGGREEDSELNAARRKAIRDLLYRKES